MLSLVAALGLAAAAQNADARGYGHHHHARVGVFIGAPLFPFYSPYYYPPAYYPPAYYPPVAVAPSAPPVYIEQSTGPAGAPPAAAAQGQSGYWYYCQDTQTYYPYAQQCASPWQQVQPQASAAAPVQ